MLLWQVQGIFASFDALRTLHVVLARRNSAKEAASSASKAVLSGPLALFSSDDY